MDQSALTTNPQPASPAQTSTPHRNIVPLVIVAVIAALLASLGTYFVMSSNQNKQSQMSYQQSTPTNQASPIESTTEPTTPVTKHTTEATANWQTQSGAVYSVKYPSTWIAKEVHDDYFGDEVTVTNSSKSVVLRVLTGKQPYGFAGPSDTKTNDLTITVESQKIPVKETIVDNRAAYVDNTYIERWKRISNTYWNWISSRRR